MDKFSAMILPCVILGIVLHGVVRGVKVFDCFLQGAKSGLKVAENLLPALMALVVSVSMLRASGALDAAVSLLRPVAAALGVPPEVMPLALLSPISGSGSLSMYEGILQQYGAESVVGQVASVLMGASETTFYAVTVYYGSIGVQKTGATIPAALAADFVSLVAAAWSVRLLL